MNKKIAFFTPSLNIGGIERVFMTYANSLTNNYNVEYVICYEKGDLGQYLNQNVKTTILHTRLSYSLIKLARYIRKNKPDYIITGGDIPNAMVLIANKISGSRTKVIISQHNYLNIEQNIYLSIFIYRFIYNYAYKIIAVSDDIAKFIKGFKIEQDKVVIIYNPINIQSIQDLSKKLPEKINYSNYILYVGRLSAVKNLEFLVKSFSLLKKEKPELNLILAGNGPMQKPLELLVKNLDIQNSVSFLGIIANPYPLIKNSLFVVLPSFSEALPTIILECFALGKTIVGTPTKGALDLLENGKYGFISNLFNDEQEFSKLMDKALNTPINIEELKNYASTFDISFKVGEIQSILI
jgi:GalNAc-alpha-(1->4)-GalNAc-alpha-(1->3)-diNAcBac-PP-undecaprenol alpha-1,4-N-acetyl-D-galactosaminyltransferase